MKYHFIKNLASHYLSATFIDVLHSPFVFSLYQNCIKKQKPEQVFTQIEKIRKQLLESNEEISYEDFGASNKSRVTRVSKLAASHLKPARLAQILYHMAGHLPCKTFLELGTSFGITSSYIASGAKPGAHLYSIEACGPVREKAIETMGKLGISNTSLKAGVFDEVLPVLLPEIGKLDFLFIDGNHSYEATLRYFEMCKPFLHNESVVIFDDIYWSPGMTKAWEEIKADPFVQVSVDTFFLGMVFFRKEQVKQHFRLRIF